MARTMMPDVRLWTIAAVVAAALLAVVDYRQWDATLARLIAASREAGLDTRVPQLELELRRQASPARATIYAAWAAVVVELDRSWMGQLDAAERAAEERLGSRRLRLAARLAARGLAEQPVSWQAAAALGGARYLLSRREPLAAAAAGGGAEPQPPAGWREPLRAAMRLAPGQPEPPRILASALLSDWSSLDRDDRRAAQPVLERALADRRGLDFLLPTWVRLAPSRAQLFAPIPDRPWAWERLGRELLALDDLERYCAARQRWYAAVAAALPGWRLEAESRLRGDRRRAAGFYRLILEQPADAAFAAELSAALATLPPELVDEPMRRELRRWLRWATDLCAAGFCPLAAQTARRLAAPLDDLDAPEAALAALLAGDLERAAARAATADLATNGRWERYLVLAARRQLDAGRPAAARTTLDRLAAAQRDGPLYWIEAERLARAEGDPAAVELARRRLARLAGTSWGAELWRHDDGVYRLPLLAAGPAAGIRVEPRWAPAEGSVVELRWDGRQRELLPVGPGGYVRWRRPVAAGLHLLEFTDALGRRTTPAAVSLEPVRTAP